MDQNQDHELFNLYKTTLVHELGRGPLDQTTINRIGKREFGKRFGGCIPSDRVKIKPGKYYVINTSSHGQRGIHWVGGYSTRSTFYIYDSYDRPIKRLLPRLAKSIERRGLELGTHHHPHDQIGHT